jgi:hypothetical protein
VQAIVRTRKVTALTENLFSKKPELSIIYSPANRQGKKCGNMPTLSG